MEQIQIPDCQYCKSPKWMRLAGETDDHIAFKCIKCGCVKAWASPSMRARARAEALRRRLNEQESRARALDSRPKIFDYGRSHVHSS